MKTTVIKYIFIFLGVFLLTGYLVFAAITFYPTDNEIVCKDLVITFPFNEKNSLYTKNDISAILDNADLHPIGESYKDINTEKIEKKLK